MRERIKQDYFKRRNNKLDLRSFGKIVEYDKK